MRCITIIFILIGAVSAKDEVELGVFAGAFIPIESFMSSTYNTSPELGADILLHLENYILEGKISFIKLIDDTDIENFSASMTPIRGGLRNYIGSFLLGGGVGLYIVTERYDDPQLGTFDETSSLYSAYINLGYIISAAGTRIELITTYHLVDLVTEKSWIGITAGLRL